MTIYSDNRNDKMPILEANFDANYKGEKKNDYNIISPFSINGISFSSMEQYMMYRKAIIFTDNATAAEILACEDVSRIKELGRLVSGYDESYWNGQNLLGYTLMAVRNIYSGYRSISLLIRDV